MQRYYRIHHETTDFLRKVKHIRPTTEKIYNSIRKELNNDLDIVKYKSNIYYLINNGIVEVRGDGDQESVFIVERTEERLQESGEKAAPLGISREPRYVA